MHRCNPKLYKTKKNKKYMKTLDELEGPSFDEISAKELYVTLYGKYIRPIQTFKEEGDNFLRCITENTFKIFARESHIQRDVDFLIQYLNQSPSPNPELIELFVQKIECIKYEEYENAGDIMQEIKHLCYDEAYQN